MVKKTEKFLKKTEKLFKKKVNKGAWTAEEDRKLTDYVKTHGDKQWTTIPTEAGLNRCGKSCRLRWLNYLRPGIKRGNITEDEEDLIIRLHNLLGNRWSLIAGRLPGRTDNEIKNHWNTHLSKKSLTINELNLKLNQKLENEPTNPTTPTFQNPSSSFAVAPNVNWVGIMSPPHNFKDTDDTEISREINELFDNELDVDGFFNFSAASSLTESDPLGTSSELAGQEDYNLLSEGFYQNLLDTELDTQGISSSTESVDEQFSCNKLDFDRLTQLLDCEDDVLLPFF